MINLIRDKISPAIDSVIYLHGVLTPSKHVRASPAYGVVKLLTYPTSSRAGTQQELLHAFHGGLDLFSSELKPELSFAPRHSVPLLEQR